MPSSFCALFLKSAKIDPFINVYEYNTMLHLRKPILFLAGLGSLIMVAVGLSQIPTQSTQIVSDSNQGQAVSAANNQYVVNSRGFIIAMIGSGTFLSTIILYVYVYSDICRREHILREVNDEIRAAQVVPVATPVAAPVEVKEVKPILKVIRAPGAPRAPAPFPPRPTMGPVYGPVYGTVYGTVYGHNAEIYKKSIAQRYHQLKPRV